MEQILQFLTEWGYAGILISSFLAGSIIPFASEVVVVAVVQAGLSPVWCVVWATLGNTLGGVTCYLLGRAGKTVWIERWLRIKPATIERAQRFLHGRGAVMALFVALPYIGDAIAVVLGLMRANMPLTFGAMAVGKCIRYILVVGAAAGIISLF